MFLIVWERRFSRNDLNCGNSWPHKHNLYLLPPYEFIYFPKIKTKWMFYKSKRIKSSSWNHLNVNKKTTLNGGLAKSWTCWTLLFLSKSLTLMSCFHITASSYCAGLVSISYPRTSIHFRVVLLLLSYLDFLLLRSWLLFLFFVSLIPYFTFLSCCYLYDSFRQIMSCFWLFGCYKSFPIFWDK